jgi:ATP-dependent exoDNAse (exonuclease V) alpha subunit
MPVIITENFDVVGGIINGSAGTLRKVRYRVDDADRRYLTSCIVELPDVTADALPNLPPKHVTVLPKAIEMKPFYHLNSGHSCKLHRYQVPLDAGFAITTHKAQDQTLKRAIVDLASCIGKEATYVMVSQCTSLEGLMVLQPFPIGKITTHRSQEARDEF